MIYWFEDTMEFDRRQFVRKAYTGLAEITDMLGQDLRAVRYYERGLDFSDGPADRSEILQSIGQVYVDQSRFSDAMAMAHKARRALEPIRRKAGTGYYRRQASIHVLRSWIHRLKGSTTRAMQEAKAGLRLLAPYARDRDNLDQISDILNSLAGVYYLLGDPRCLDYYRRAIKLEKRLGNVRAVATLKNNLGSAYSGFGNNRKGIALTREYLKISEQIGDWDGISVAAESLGAMYYSLGDHRRAIEYLLRSYRMSKETGSDYSISYTSSNLGVVFRGIGEDKKALEYFRQDLLIARRDGVKRNEARALYNIGSVHLRAEEYEKARHYLEPALRILERIRDRVRLQNALHHLAVAVASRKSGCRRALELLRRSARLARSAPPRSEVAAVQVSAGKVMGFIGDAAKIKRHFEKALAIYRQDGLRRSEADACMDYARTLMSLPGDRRPEPGFIRRLAERARAIYAKQRIEKKLSEADGLIKKNE